MSAREGNVREGEAALQRRWLWWLIAGRVLVAGLLFSVSALWTGGFASGAQEPGRPGGALLLAGLVVALSVLYALALRFSPLPLRAQADAQFALDALIITWLVLVTGNVYSPYSALYIVVISVASIFVGARGGLLTSVGCASCYTAAMLALTAGWLGGHGRYMPTASTASAIEAVGLHDVAFLVVGLLSARLAERQTRSEVEMREAARSLASLRALHERIVESIRSGVITTDLDRRVYTMNAAAEEMTGYADEDLRGQDVSILFGDIRVPIEESLRAASEGEVSPRHEAECLTSEGFLVKLGYSVSPLSSESGETTGLVITFQDLTDVRAMEETSRRQERLSAVGRVAAGIAHEIRNQIGRASCRERGEIGEMRGALER